VAQRRAEPGHRSIPTLIAACAALAVALGIAFAVPEARSRALATCNPTAYVPVISGSQSEGKGIGTCDAGAPSWQYTVRLVNRAGDILAQTSGGPWSGTHTVSTSTVSCAGAYVHSYLYINVGGTGKSDTSGEVGCALFLATPAVGDADVLLQPRSYFWVGRSERAAASASARDELSTST
jgi:hypothetical protein